MTDKEPVALKPCPHCGSTTAPQAFWLSETDGDDFDTSNEEDSIAVICDASSESGIGPRGCGASGGYKATEAAAIAAWNCRSVVQAGWRPPAGWPEATEDFRDFVNDWARAYPLGVFPEPDLKRAAELLGAGGITLDAVSASAMRHVITKVAERFNALLPPPPAAAGGEA